jgi:hypothetical protein
MWECEMECTSSKQPKFEALHSFISTIIKLLIRLGILFSLIFIYVCISQLYSKKQQQRETAYTNMWKFNLWIWQSVAEIWQYQCTYIWKQFQSYRINDTKVMEKVWHGVELLLRQVTLIPLIKTDDMKLCKCMCHTLSVKVKWRCSGPQYGTGQPWGANLEGDLRPYWNNRKYGASKLRFRHAKKFLENYPLGSLPQKGYPAMS